MLDTNFQDTSQSEKYTPLAKVSMNNSDVRDKAMLSNPRTLAAGDDMQDAQGQEGKPRLTIKQLRQAAQGAAQNNPTQTAAHKQQKSVPVSVPTPQKKKPSIFGGLFQVKEPTQIALNQVAAQMIAQHGSTSPTKVPNVRLEKMPDHVPKVNAKWDGIPESVKQQEKREKERAKASKKDDCRSSDHGSRSSDTRDNGRRGLSSSNSNSTTGSFGSGARSITSNSNSGQTRFYAQSVNSSGDLASQQRTDRSQPRRSSFHSYATSATSVPESVPESAMEAVPEIPQYFREAITAAESTTEANLQRDTDKDVERPATVVEILDDKTSNPKIERTPRVEDVPQHSTSPLPSPQDILPPTPLLLHPSNEPMLRNKSPVCDQASSANVIVLAAPSVVKKKLPPIITSAFLAGEAQELVLQDEENDGTKNDLPLRHWESGVRTVGTATSATPRVQQDLEKRPDSSRARLGLRASMLLSEEETPWEATEQDMQAFPSPKTPMTPRTPTSPRTFSSPRTKFPKGFNLFNKEKNRS